MTVVVGVDGAGRTYRLGRLVAASGTAAWWVTGSADGLATARADGSLVVVDDAHRLPADTLRALAAAARAGVPMVMSRRPTIDRPELAELDEAVSATGGVELVGPLGRDALAALVATVTGRPVSPDTAAAVHDASAGLAAVAAAVAASAGPGPAPALVARVQRRFAILPPDVGAVGRLLALRLDLTDDMLATAAEVPADALPTLLRTLRDEGLLVPGGERMIPAVADAVLGELPAAERRRVHDRVARALVAAGADPLLTAAQLRAARVLTPAAARVYVRAGERTRFTDPAAAMAWFDDAAESGASPAEVIAGRAEAGALLGLRVDTDLPEAVPPETAARLALLTGATATHDGRSDRAADTLLAAPPPGPLLAVPVLVSTGRLAEARAAVPDRPRAAPDRASRGPADLSPGGRAGQVPADSGTGRPAAADAASGGRAGLGDPAGSGLEGRVAGAIAPADSGSGGAVARLAEAVLVAAEDPDTAVPLLIEAAEVFERATPTAVLPDTPHAIGAVVAVLTGDLATAEHLLTRAGAGPAAAERHRMLLAWARMRAGRFPTALAELARPEGAEPPGRERLLRAAVAAGIARRRGDIAGLRAVWAGVEPALARRAVDLWQIEAVEELLVAAARLHQRRRVEPVLALLERAVGGLGPAWEAALRWVRVQVAVADGDAGEVAAQANRLVGLRGAGPRADAQAEAATLWAELLTGADVGPARVLAATDRLAEVELPWEASRLAGQAAIHATDPVIARRLLERARELSEPDTTTAAAEPPARVGHTGGLSERELAVARLVLRGSTHKEIGAQLYIAPKTVEHHVARIRSKLGAGSRAELLATLREIIPDPG